MRELLREAWPARLRRHAANLLGPDRPLVLRGILIYTRLMILSGLCILASLGSVSSGLTAQHEWAVLAVASVILGPGLTLLILMITNLKRVNPEQARLMLAGSGIRTETLITAMLSATINLTFSDANPLVILAGTLFGGLTYAGGLYLKCVRTLLRDVPRPPRRRAARLWRVPPLGTLQPATIPVRR